MSNIYWRTAKDLDLDALAELGSLTEPNQAQAVHAAFQRLQTKAMQDAAKAQIEAAADQKEAANAQIRAAIATEATAVSTRDSAWWLMWSVIVLAITSILNNAATVWDHYSALPAVTPH